MGKGWEDICCWRKLSAEPALWLPSIAYILPYVIARLNKQSPIYLSDKMKPNYTGRKFVYLPGYVHKKE